VVRVEVDRLVERGPLEDNLVVTALPVKADGEHLRTDRVPHAVDQHD